VLRASILHKRLKLSYRVFCKILAGSPLYQWFCGLNSWLGTRIPSFSKLNKLENSLTESLLKKANELINGQVLFNNEACKLLGFDQEFQLNEVYMDSTCLESNIHYPVDWVLFRDLIRTSMLKVKKIRDGGIKVRIPKEVDEYLSEINNLCIKIHAVFGTTSAKKKRKAVFREMKILLKKAMGHSQSHLDKFKREWANKGFSPAKATQIINVLEDMLSQYPKVVAIANARIISEKKIKRKDKIVSIYEKEVQIIQRKKHSATTEFGNTLQLVEQKDGFIISYDLLKEYSPGDAKLGIKSIKDIQNWNGLELLTAIIGDRGYDSLEFKEFIKTLNESKGIDIQYSITPVNPSALSKSLEDEIFRDRMKRRASTEAKVAHIKAIIGNPIVQKGIENKQTHTGIAILTHNLSKASKMLREKLAEVSQHKLAS
jgi:hypothetical protein